MRGLCVTTLTTAALIATAPGPPGTNSALALLLVAVAAIRTLTPRLAWNSSVKRGWEERYGRRAEAGA